ncbi:PDZ domain-containing protein [Hyphomonas sp.]|uniref:PDZ domain-containing protein n=1 Tax=Hyphomonas sp. TaxID=87 RepID=UPI0035282A7A
MSRRWFAIALLGCAAACSSGYSQFYTDYSQGVDYIAPPTHEPEIVNVPGSPQEVIYAMFTNGYQLIGESSFNGPSEDTSGAIAQAKKVGAEYIVLNSEYTNTVSGSIPMTTSKTITSNTSGTATAYGTGGMATGYYNGTTTTTVPTTTYIPYSTRRYDQNALFFAPMIEPCLGIYPEELNDREKSGLGTNKGFRVAAVRKGSPAYNADILPNDYILTVNGIPVTDAKPPSASEYAEFGIVRRVGDSAEKISIALTTGNGCRN